MSDAAPAARPGATPLRVGALVASWLGLANLVFVLGSSVLRQWSAYPDISGGPHPIGDARSTAISGLVAGLAALAFGRLRWRVLLFALLLGVWTAAGSLSTWVLTGQIPATPLLLALTSSGLALSAAVSRQVLAGWTVFLIGCAYVYLNLALLWRLIPSGESAPAGPMATLRWMLDVQGFGGLATNGNLTGNYLAFLVVFMAPFVLGRFRGPARRRLLMMGARAGLLLVSALPGLLVLHTVAARTALIAVVLGWGVLAVPRRVLRSRWTAALAALGTPLLMLAPVLFAQRGVLSASGRDCVWGSWRDAMANTYVWGLGAPGTFPGTRCSVPIWSHAHNDLLQAWSVSGIAGLAAATLLVAGLAYAGARHADADDRALAVLMACAAVLMGFEVVASFSWAFIALGISAFAAIASRSLQLVGAPDQAGALKGAGATAPSGPTPPDPTPPPHY